MKTPLPPLFGLLQHICFNALFLNAFVKKHLKTDLSLLKEILFYQTSGALQL